MLIGNDALTGNSRLVIPLMWWSLAATQDEASAQDSMEGSSWLAMIQRMKNFSLCAK